MDFNYKLEPGSVLKRKNRIEKIDNPPITIITPFYNSKKEFMTTTAYSILNQTYDYFEWLIIDDGSTDRESLEFLKEIEKMDNRIKVFHKENEGLAQTRDYGAKKSSQSSKYLMFLDDDDQISDTFVECAYWTLETNQGASWAYSDSVGFGEQEYTWRKWYYPLKEKKENQLVSAAMIRKSDFFEVGGYELKEKNVYEDWNLWLKLIAKGKYPVKMSFFGLWYRRKNQKSGELARAKANHARAMEIIEGVAKKIEYANEGIQYPKQDYNWEEIADNVPEINIPKVKVDNKIKILMIIPWMVTGGADRFNLELVRRVDTKKYEFIIVTTLPSTNDKRQEFEEFATVYDLTSFLDKKYWLSFINFLIEKNNIDIIFNINSQTGYTMLPYLKLRYPKISILDYVHMEEWYWRNGGFARDSKAFDSVIDKTLTCNESTKDILIKQFGKEKSKVQNVYIGVDETIFNPELYNGKEILKKLNIQAENKKIISYICRITEQKRPYLLLEIIKQLKEKRNDFLVIVAGDGLLLNDVKEKAKKLAIQENIMFLGNVTHTEEIYAISDLTINCSIKEGVALTSYESLSMGVPVVSSDVGGQKELIDDFVGKIVPCLQEEFEIKNFIYKDEEVESYVIAINNILDNLERYKKNCRKKIIDNFTLDKMVNKMEQIFQEEAKKTKIQMLDSNKHIYKELISYYFISEIQEYNYLVETFIKENIDKDVRFEKTGKYYEGTIEYKIKHFIIRVLKKVGLYKFIKK